MEEEGVLEKCISEDGCYEVGNRENMCNFNEEERMVIYIEKNRLIALMMLLKSIC